jgi:Mce-associated membrane protein
MSRKESTTMAERYTSDFDGVADDAESDTTAMDRVDDRSATSENDELAAGPSAEGATDDGSADEHGEEAGDEAKPDRSGPRDSAPKERTKGRIGGAARSMLTGSVSALRWLGRRPLITWRWYRSLLGERATLALGGLGVVALVLALVAGGAWWLGRSGGAAVGDRGEAVATASSEVAALLSYDASNVDGLVSRVGDGLSDGFRTDYTILITQVIAPAAKQQQITTRAEVVGTSTVLDAGDGDQVTALLFVNQNTQAGGGPAQVSGSRVRVVMGRDDGRWLLSDMKPV